MLRLKRVLHVFIAITVIATIYVLTQEKRSIELEAFQQEIGWQERAPRSLSNDYESNAVEILKSTATPSPSTASARDLFISIKTTVHYHQARLPIILKTWFQLAPEQKLKMLSYFVGLEEELVYFLLAEVVAFFSIFVMRSLLKPDDTVLKALWQREDEEEVFYDALSCKKDINT